MSVREPIPANLETIKHFHPGPKASDFGPKEAQQQAADDLLDEAARIAYGAGVGALAPVIRRVESLEAENMILRSRLEALENTARKNQPQHLSAVERRRI